MIRRADFRPLWWLSNPHLQTLWPVFASRRRFSGRKKRLELPDSDFLELEWLDGDGPLVVVMHGLEGSIQSHYANAMMDALGAAGFEAVFMHFRNCGDQPNRLDRSYHSGDTADLAYVVDIAAKQTGKPVFAVIGYSLSGNVLLKWLGESGDAVPVQKAVAVSVPFQLEMAAQRLQRGLSWIYQTHLLGNLRKAYKQKFAQRPAPLEVDVDTLRDFFAFDDQVTAPLHGFAGVDDYYTRSSCRQYLPGIRRDTLVLHSLDDPFMYPEAVPEESELPECVTLELSVHGGHVGFIGGRWLPQRWLEPRILRYLTSP